MQHTMFVMTLSFNNGEKNTSQANSIFFFDCIKFAETWTSTKVQNCTCFIQLIVISLLFCFVTKMKMCFYFYDCKMNVMADCKSIKLHSRHLRVIEVKKRSCSKQYWLWHRQFEWVLYILSLYNFHERNKKIGIYTHTLPPIIGFHTIGTVHFSFGDSLFS